MYNLITNIWFGFVIGWFAPFIAMLFIYTFQIAIEKNEITKKDNGIKLASKLWLTSTRTIYMVLCSMFLYLIFFIVGFDSLWVKMYDTFKIGPLMLNWGLVIFISAGFICLTSWDRIIKNIINISVKYGDNFGKDFNNGNK